MNEKATLLTITEPRNVPHCAINPHCTHNPHCGQICIFQRDGMVKIRKQIYSATNEVISFDLDGDGLFEKEIIYDYKTNMTNFYTITYRRESLKD